MRPSHAANVPFTGGVWLQEIEARWQGVWKREATFATPSHAELDTASARNTAICAAQLELYSETLAPPSATHTTLRPEPPTAVRKEVCVQVKNSVAPMLVMRVWCQLVIAIPCLARRPSPSSTRSTCSRTRVGRGCTCARPPTHRAVPFADIQFVLEVYCKHDRGGHGVRARVPASRICTEYENQYRLQPQAFAETQEDGETVRQ